jgi:pSer/pThr/pTyr-binding forkhead associated (FHA) protein
MQKSLTVVGGTNHGRVVPIIMAEFRIGRDASCHLRPASTDISRIHCAIITHPDGSVFIRDFGSQLGTIINHRALIGGEIELQDGDILEVGPLMFRFTLQAPASSTIASSLQGTTPNLSLPATTVVPAPVPKPPNLPGLTHVSSIPSPRMFYEESALETNPDNLPDSHIFCMRDDSSVEIPGIDTLPNVPPPGPSGNKRRS